MSPQNLYILSKKDCFIAKLNSNFNFNLLENEQTKWKFPFQIYQDLDRITRRLVIWLESLRYCLISTILSQNINITFPDLQENFWAPISRPLNGWKLLTSCNVVNLTQRRTISTYLWWAESSDGLGFPPHLPRICPYFQVCWIIHQCFWILNLSFWILLLFCEQPQSL